MKTAAIYARVSSDQQREEKTIASQTAALREFAEREGYQVPDEWIFEDEGHSGASLVRPGLERIRDLAAEGQILTVLALPLPRSSRSHRLLPDHLPRVMIARFHPIPFLHFMRIFQHEHGSTYFTHSNYSLTYIRQV